MPSPSCQVKDGAGAYQSTIGGVNVTPSNTVTINLISAAGVSTWNIQCISTDDSSSTSSVNASLVIDTVAKTATFTAPAAGRAYRFKSTINNGLNANGAADDTYSTTFGVYTLTSSRRVIAVDETFESDATFGWIKSINALIRNPTAVTTPTGTGFYTITGGVADAAATSAIRYTGGKLQTDANVQWKNSSITGDLAWTPTTSNKTLTLPDATDTLVGKATTDTLTNKTLTSPALTTPKISDSSGGQFYNFAVSDLAADRTVTLPLLAGNDTFVFEGHTQTLTNKTLTSPTLGGTITYSATSSQATGNARCKVYSDISNVQTTDATVTTLFSWTILDEAATKVVAEVLGDRSTGAETAAYVRQVRIKRDGGTVTVGTVATPFTDEEVGTWDCTIDNSTSTGRVRVTGVAAVTIDWGGVINRIEVNHA